MAPRSDAHALYILLTELVSKSPVTPVQRWPEILEAEWGTPDFARRHAEVVALFNSTMIQIESMEHRSRERFGRYLNSWWRAAVLPEGGWGAQLNAESQIIAQKDLDQLDSAAELIEARMANSLAVPDAIDLAPLREQCMEWATALNGEDSGVPHTLRMNLLQDLSHLIWLIDHAELFGVARVAASGQATLGNLVLASHAVGGPQRGAWLQRAKSFVRVLVAFSAILQGVQTGVELGPGVADIFGEITEGDVGS